MAKNSLQKEVDKQRALDKLNLQRTLQGGVSKSEFADRPDLISAKQHPIGNALFTPIQTGVNFAKGIGSFGSGLSTLVSAIPSIANSYLKFYGKDIQKPEVVQKVLTDAVNAIPSIAKGIGYQWSKQYGQEHGFKPGNIPKALKYYPFETAMDILTAGGVANKALTGSANLSKTVGKLGKAGEAFNAMGEIPRYKGGFKGKVKPALSTAEQAVKNDNFIKFATQSGANQYGKGFKGAGEIKGFKALSPGQQHTFSHIYGDMLGKANPETTKAVVDAAKAQLGIQSLKDVPTEQLPSLVDAVRANMPVINAKNLDVGSTRFAKNIRLPEQYIPSLKDPIMKNVAKGNTAFKASVLGQIPWLTGNFAGDIYHTATGGEKVSNVIKLGLDPRYKALVSEKDLGGFYKNTEKYLQAVEQMKKEAPVVHKIAKYAQPFFRMEGARENVFRQGVFASQLNKMAEASLKAKGIKPTSEALFNEASRLSRISPAYDEAIKQSKQVLGDYRSFRPGESGMSAIVPFYKWFREASKIAAHQPIRNPIGAGRLKAYSEFGQDIQEQQKNFLNEMGYDIPAYNKGGYVTGVNEQGVPQIFNAGKLLPITTVSGMAQDLAEGDLRGLVGTKLTPALSIPEKILSGTNFTGRPATSPNVIEDFNGIRYYRNPNTGEKTQIEPSNLAPGEGLNYLGSELARNYTPLGQLERAMPYQSYDTRMFQPDPTRQSKMQNFARIMGLGTTSNAFKIPPIDAQRLEDRYNKKYFGY